MSFILKQFIWLRSNLIASWFEITVVLSAWCIYPAYISAKNAMHGSSRYYAIQFSSDPPLLYNLIWNSAALAVMLIFMHWRGWIAFDLKITISWLSVIQTILLFVLAKIAYSAAICCIGIVFFFCQHASGHGLDGTYLTAANYPSSPSWVVLILSAIVNAYSEEIPIMAYAFNQIACKNGPFVALIVTVLLRMSYHTYEGVVHEMALSAVFLTLGIFYWRQRALFPVIFAHMLFDLVPFNVLKTIFT